MKNKIVDLEAATKLLVNQKIGVLPTDTIYGIHTSAFNKNNIENLYALRGRDENKPFIILISDISDLKQFDIKVSSTEETILKKLWPNPVSIILPSKAAKFKYLHRGTKQLAFRNPRNQELLKLLQTTGPLVSTSVNKQGEKPAETIAEAKKLFGRKLDFFVDNGHMPIIPSTVIKLSKGEIEVLREGVYKIKK